MSYYVLFDAWNRKIPLSNADEFQQECLHRQKSLGGSKIFACRLLEIFLKLIIFLSDYFFWNPMTIFIIALAYPF